MKSIWIMGTECYIKTQVEIDTHSKIYIFLFFFNPFIFQPWHHYPWLLLESWAPEQSPQVSPSLPFTLSIDRFQATPCPGFRFHFCPIRSSSRVTGLLALVSERRELSLKAECGICCPGICEQLTFALRIGSRLWTVSTWKRGWSTLFSSPWLARGAQLVSIIFLYANLFRKGIQI